MSQRAAARLAARYGRQGAQHGTTGGGTCPSSKATNGCSLTKADKGDSKCVGGRCRFFSEVDGGQAAGSLGCGWRTQTAASFIAAASGQAAAAGKPTVVPKSSSSQPSSAQPLLAAKPASQAKLPSAPTPPSAKPPVARNVRLESNPQLPPKPPLPLDPTLLLKPVLPLKAKCAPSTRGVLAKTMRATAESSTSAASKCAKAPAVRTTRAAMTEMLRPATAA